MTNYDNYLYYDQIMFLLILLIIFFLCFVIQIIEIHIQVPESNSQST